MIVDAAKAVRIEQEVARRGGLDLKRHGAEMIGPCPQCGGRDRFAINVIKQCFLCRGCDAAGDVIALVQHLDRCDFRTAVQILGGVEMRSDPFDKSYQMDHRPIDLANQPAIDRQNTTWALKIWNEATPIGGTPAEQYLQRRGLHDLSGDQVLRFHPQCAFRKSRLPCLVALYRSVATDEPQAIARTALDAAGNKGGRMTLGPVRGAAIKVDPDENVEQGLAVAEGLETALAARQLGFRPAWALGSAGAIRTLPVLAGINALTIITDNDEPDQRGRQAGQEAAAACSERWRAAGAEVRRVIPRATGADMADIAAQERGRRHG